MPDEMSGVEKQPKKKYEKPRLDKEPSQAERLTSLQKPPEPIPVPDMREAGTFLAVGAGVVGAAAGKLFGKGKEERAEAESISTPEPGVKEGLPALETKEREIETFSEAMEYLKDNWRMADSLPDDEKRQFATSLKIKLESARWASRTRFFEGAKSKVADLMQKLVEDDNFWASVQASGMPRGEQISALASRLDALRNDIPDAEGNREGLRDAWLENIARDWRLAYLRAKDSAGHPGNRTDQIKELEDERRYLGWGSVKTPGTQILIQELAERAASWDEQNDPGLKKWSEARAQAEAVTAARAQAPGIGGLGKLTELMERGYRTRESEAYDPDIFDEEFLQAHELPPYVYVAEQGDGGVTISAKRDMQTVLADAFRLGTTSGINLESIRRALFEVRKTGNGELTQLERKQITQQAQRAFDQLVYGIFPLIIIRLKDNGTFGGLAGNPNLKTNEGQQGVLNSTDLNIKSVAEAFQNDSKAKRALGIWLALRGQQVKKETMSPEDLKLVEKHRPAVLQMMAYDHNGLVWDKAIADMKKIGEEIQGFGIDLGRVELMREISVLLAGGPELADYRKLLRISGVHRTLWDPELNPGAFDPESLKELANLRSRKGADDPEYMSKCLELTKEGAAKTALEKIKHGSEKRLTSDEIGTGFGYLSGRIIESGVDGLFEGILKLTNGKILQGQYFLYYDILDKLDTLKNYFDGKDAFSDTFKRREEINKIVDGLAGGDIPKIRDSTNEAIKRIHIHGGAGQFAEAAGTFSDKTRSDIDLIIDTIGIRGLINFFRPKR